MFVIPMLTDDGRADYWIVLEDDNMVRLKTHDPAEVVFRHMPEQWQRVPVRTIVLAYASPADRLRVFELTMSGQIAEALRVLSRGYQYREGVDGSGDPYESLRTKGEV